MARSPNSQLAIDMYDALPGRSAWTAATAWHGIARLLLNCEIWDNNRKSWQSFQGTVVYCDSDKFKPLKTGGPNAAMRCAQALSIYLANQLGVLPPDLCREIGRYWRHPAIAALQPNNVVGHAFRSLTVHALQSFGDPNLSYEEEVDPYTLVSGVHFSTRSSNPRMDIVAYRNKVPVAFLSSRWRFRHDRVDVVDEALAYASHFRRAFPTFRLYASVGEFLGARLKKILDHCPPTHAHPPLNAVVHFAPNLITTGMGQNGRLAHLQSLEWLINETFSW